MRLAWLVLGCSCGRIDFAPPDARGVFAESSACRDATFSLPPMSSLADDFTTNALTDQWTPTAACIDQTGGELVAAPSNIAESYCHAWTNSNFHLSCDSVTFEVAMATPADVGVQTFLYVAGPDNVALELILEGGGIGIGVASSAEMTDLGPYDPMGDRWWRLRESDGELVFETSPDRQTWSSRPPIPDPIALDNVHLALGAGVWKDVAVAGSAHFRCLNVPSPCP